ncbi:virulence RhuM family protein [Bifidobacterium crudilactis]|jgi:hypothetical protein|uniref:virulence RhuM family protein n=1 Tax=Bifidobacterium crudilactis TaxID=327277 RepID=UPI0006902537|nr:RhuM family protein [Bifidobacterium crudilactis]MCI2148262.1 virulence RhuM family protein [Bifidobacterium crudilactis]MCI2158126.1 virulence RhuM family protein [Bifidobacterium crudilactis]
MSSEPTGEIILYHQDDGTTEITVRLEDETVWLSQQQIAELFGTTRENITMHLRNIFNEGELDEEATSKDFLQVRNEGSRRVNRHVMLYNLDAILSVGYRVKSATATRFRIWATDRLRDYLVKGYAVNQQRLDQIGQVVRILGRATDELVSGSVDILAMYLPGLELLRDNWVRSHIGTNQNAVPGHNTVLQA